MVVETMSDECLEYSGSASGPPWLCRCDMGEQGDGEEYWLLFKLGG